MLPLYDKWRPPIPLKKVSISESLVYRAGPWMFFTSILCLFIFHLLSPITFMPLLLSSFFFLFFLFLLWPSFPPSLTLSSFRSTSGSAFCFYVCVLNMNYILLPHGVSTSVQTRLVAHRVHQPFGPLVLNNLAIANLRSPKPVGKS